MEKCNRSTRKIYSVIFLSMLLILGLVFYLLNDETMDWQVQNYLQRVQITQKDNPAYFYLLGIGAAEWVAPEAKGGSLYHDFLRWDSVQPDAYSTSATVFEITQDLPMPDTTELCLLDKVACYRQLFNEPIDAQLLNDHYATLLDRYQSFLRMQGYQTLLVGLRAPIPKFAYVLKANDILLVRAIHTAKKGKVDQALQQVQHNMVLLRQKLAQADTLIEKMIYTELVSRNLDTMSLIIKTFHYDGIVRVASLNADEMDFSKVAAYEFLLTARILDEMAGDSDSSWGCEDSPICWLKRKFYFKPNSVLNLRYKSLQQLIKLSQKGSINFAQYVVQKNKPVFSIRAWLVDMTDDEKVYHEYLQRVFSLDAKILMLNATANQQKMDEIILLNVKNPYFEYKTAVLSQDKSSLCFEEPIPVGREDSCLKVAF